MRASQPAWTPSRAVLTELAVLAAASVIAGEPRLLLVMRFLAGDAQAHTGDGLASRFGNLRTAFLAMRQARSLRQLAANALDRVLDGGVDLVLHGAVACPASCHGSSPQSRPGRKDSGPGVNPRRNGAGLIPPRRWRRPRLPRVPAVAGQDAARTTRAAPQPPRRSRRTGTP